MRQRYCLEITNLIRCPYHVGELLAIWCKTQERIFNHLKVRHLHNPQFTAEIYKIRYLFQFYTDCLKSTLNFGFYREQDFGNFDIIQMRLIRHMSRLDVPLIDNLIFGATGLGCHSLATLVRTLELISMKLASFLKRHIHPRNRDKFDKAVVEMLQSLDILKPFLETLPPVDGRRFLHSTEKLEVFLFGIMK